MRIDAFGAQSWFILTSALGGSWCDRSDAEGEAAACATLGSVFSVAARADRAFRRDAVAKDNRANDHAAVTRSLFRQGCRYLTAGQFAHRKVVSAAGEKIPIAEASMQLGQTGRSIKS